MTRPDSSPRPERTDVELSDERLSELTCDLAQRLDARADQDDAFWQRQREAIRRKLSDAPTPQKARPGVRWRPAWTLAGLAASAALVLLLLAPRVFVSPD